VLCVRRLPVVSRVLLAYPSLPTYLSSYRYIAISVSSLLLPIVAVRPMLSVCPILAVRPALAVRPVLSCLWGAWGQSRRASRYIRPGPTLPLPDRSAPALVEVIRRSPLFILAVP
jgi:hypothetical protein